MLVILLYLSSYTHLVSLYIKLVVYLTFLHKVDVVNKD